MQSEGLPSCLSCASTAFRAPHLSTTMAFCDAHLGNPLVIATTTALSGTHAGLGPKEEREAAGALALKGLADDAWKAVALSASWSFWKDLTKPHNKVRPFLAFAPGTVLVDACNMGVNVADSPSCSSSFVLALVSLTLLVSPPSFHRSA